jgi:phosphopantothenoylcysteine decarboxylase/phosphopantothenate--cysteine ligase
MWNHAATCHNVDVLVQRGVRVMYPGDGSLACGETGSGRMAEPIQIMEALGFAVPFAETDKVSTSGNSNPLRPADNSLSGVNVLITSGPTREYLDPVRFISSPSSGRMGLALANEAMRRGASVHFITGPVDSHMLPTGNVEVHQVQTAREMLAVVQEFRSQCRILIFAAAVGDFRPAHSINQKIKRTGNSISLPLVENPDIAQAVGFSKQQGQVLIGFAAETNDHENGARAKLDNKRLDAIVINDVANPEIGFNSEENEVKIVTTDGQSREISKRPKPEVAFEIMETARKLLAEQNHLSV